MNKEKQIWLLGIDEVQRIKAGVLKYITHTSRSKQKSSHTPSTPRSPIRNGNTTPGRKSQRSKTRSIQPLSPLNQSRKSQINNFGSMPSGYAVKRSGKIVQISNTELGESQKSDRVDKMRLKSIQNKSISSFEIQESLEMKVRISIDDKSEKKEPENKILKTIPEEKQKLPQEKKPEIPEVIQVKKQQQTQVVSVLQLARRFGALAVKKENPVQIKKVTEEKKQLSQMASFGMKKEEDSKSLASFGKSQNPGRKISDFLNLRITETKKQRKRSNTYQQNMPHETELVKNKSPNTDRQFNAPSSEKNFEMKRTSLRESNFTIERKAAKVKPEFKSISFSEQEEEQLKIKYGILSNRLDELKSRVMEQCQQAADASIDPTDPQYIKKQSVRLYNKYSPLKNFQRICNERIKEEMIKEMRKKHQKIRLEDILRKN